MDHEITGDDLLTAWQDTMLAADLAERLAKSALDAAEDLDLGAEEAEALASLADDAAGAADLVAITARAAADRARRRAGDMRTGRVVDADAAPEQARTAEDAARDRWGAGSRVDNRVSSAEADAAPMLVRPVSRLNPSQQACPQPTRSSARPDPERQGPVGPS